MRTIRKQLFIKIIQLTMVMMHSKQDGTLQASRLECDLAEIWWKHCRSAKRTYFSHYHFCVPQR